MDKIYHRFQTYLPSEAARHRAEMNVRRCCAAVDPIEGLLKGGTLGKYIASISKFKGSKPLYVIWIHCKLNVNHLEEESFQAWMKLLMAFGSAHGGFLSLDSHVG